MNNFLLLALALIAGLVLGAIFFGGLWWTVRKGVFSKSPALWFLGSMLLRMSIVLAGFYFVGGGDWERLVDMSARIYHRAIHCDAADPHANRALKNVANREGGQPCALVPDQLIFWQHGFFKLNGTIVFTWGLMLVLAVGSKLITRRLSTDLKRSRWQNLLEIVVTGIEKQISDVGLKHPEKYIGFLGTLFLFVALAALCTVIPGYEPPTGSLSTTAALALCVFVAVPLFGIEEQGFWGYLASYTKPTIIMLPFNIISELSRTLALAVRCSAT
jgi:F-type H+-transporting ATPase subunit a